MSTALASRARALHALVLAAGVASACATNDTGTGSGTLTARIEVTGSATSTAFEAQVSLRGSPVANANVFVRDVDTGETLTLEGSAGGLYRATARGYVRTVELRITSGDDHLEATLAGPTPHVISRPPNDARVLRTGFTVLDVEWDADAPAELVEVSVGATTVTVDGDAFSAELPLAPLANGEHTLTVTRQTSLELAGGAPGSRMRSRYRVDNRFGLEG